jgi:hypothetical protein
MKPAPMNILFLCLARDCEDTLPRFFSYLEQLKSHEMHCTAIIGENGSRDGTRTLIEQATCPEIELVDTTFMERGKSRLVRMAIGRQALLEAANGRGVDQDYICVVDLDNIMREPPEPEAVMNGIERLKSDKNLFAIGATSLPVYYDLLSLRTEGHDYSNLNAEIAAAKMRPLTYFQFHQRRIYSNQRLMTRPYPILCTSSFNGFCVYNASDYWLGTYRAHNEANVCEHVTFNSSIAQATGKRMLIMPDLIVRAPADHAPVGFFRFWRDRIKERLF